MEYNSVLQAINDRLPTTVPANNNGNEANVVWTHLQVQRHLHEAVTSYSEKDGKTGNATEGVAGQLQKQDTDVC